MPKAFISGCAGTELTAIERSFFHYQQPAGLILFQRNCDGPDQVRALVDAFKEAVGHDDVFIAIDQEGGRVQRMGPPLWPSYPPARAFGRLYENHAAHGLAAQHHVARLMAADLVACGINMNCVPVLDVVQPGAHDVIGDRSYGSDPASVAALGREMASAQIAGGVVPVMKHVPGHGRAPADSHVALPTVDAALEALVQTDFPPFEQLADLPAAMTAHVLYTELDPKNAASISAPIIQEVVRHHLGFDGLLISDDVSMGALSGTIEERTVRIIEAGNDLVLHCNGRLEEMEEVAAACPVLDGKARDRVERALAITKDCDEFDADVARAILREMTPVAA